MNHGQYHAILTKVMKKNHTNSEQVLLVLNVVEDDQGNPVPEETVFKSYTLYSNGEKKPGAYQHMRNEMYKVGLRLQSEDLDEIVEEWKPLVGETLDISFTIDAGNPNNPGIIYLNSRVSNEPSPVPVQKNASSKSGIDSDLAEILNLQKALTVKIEQLAQKIHQK